MEVRDLLVTSYTPRIVNGRARRTYALVKALALCRGLDVAFLPHGGDDVDPIYESIPGVRLIRLEPSRGAARAVQFARELARGKPVPVARASSPELVGDVTRLAHERDRGRVVVDDIQAMSALLGLARRRPLIYSAHNVESTYESGFDGGPIGARLLPKLERRMFLAASEAWMVSERDIEIARRIAPAAQLRYVPNAVDVTAIEPVTPPPGSREVLMLGDFTYGPNQEGLTWFRQEVLPRVWASDPEIRVRLVGRGLDDVAFDPRITIAGFVDQLHDAYVGVAAVAVPLVSGGGSPLKLVEALAWGVPVVATPVATRGIAAAESGTHLREAAEPEAFARELVELVAHGDPAMATRARELAEREYSVEHLAELVCP